MPLKNWRGEAVDPVPFLVVSTVGVLVCFSYGPGYLLTLGFDLPVALGGSAVAATGVSGFAYHRFVWLANPGIWADRPTGARIRRLFYGAVAVALLLVLLSLPLFA